jgi:hypothetical protein
VIDFPDVEAQALATGAVVAAFVTRGTLTEGDEIELGAVSTRDPDLAQARYRRLAGREFAPGEFTAVVESVSPAALLDPLAGGACQVWNGPGEGDLVVLRVYGRAGPIVEDTRFHEMRAAVDGALRS